MTHCCRDYYDILILSTKDISKKFKGDKIIMEYEIVNLPEKTAVGISAKTNNSSPDMCKVIGNLWKRFFEEGIFFGIKNKANEKALGMYYDYENNEEGDYSTAVACEVSSSNGNNSGLSIIKIPAGKYAKFIVKGNGITAVSDFWKELWQMNLPRTFVCDFEEYQNSDMNNAEIHIYIGIK